MASIKRKAPNGQIIEFDSSWTEEADLATGRYYLTGLGTSSLGLAAGGIKTGAAGANDTEEWSYSASVETVSFD